MTVLLNDALNAQQNHAVVDLLLVIHITAWLADMGMAVEALSQNKNRTFHMRFT